MSRSPNDLLSRRSKTRITHASPHGSPTPATTALKHMFINKTERAKLMAACAKGDLDAVTHLLATTKPNLNPDLVRDSKLRTPLLVACAAGKAEVVRELIRWGADVNNPLGDIIGNRPIDLAVISNSVETVLALLEAGAKVAPPFTPPKAPTSGGPVDPTHKEPVRRRNSPLDLAQSRLDWVIQQRKNHGQAANPKHKDQVIQIIQMLKYAVNDTPHSDHRSEAASTTLDELTAKLSVIGLEEPSETKLMAETEVMEGLRDVISNMKI